ncbi:SCAN domain-containing protein 3-like [Tachypleus tridentatus]|uniref:SCAN domain-containing protein 3-like n=1 Tax=Tachypleus tridentatus TaxID=6853 RepID=UPI003FD58B54
MADDVEKQLVAQLQVKTFALQSDESCLQNNEALLMTYVRLFWVIISSERKYFFPRKLATDRKGETIFEEVKSYCIENNIPFENITTCEIDGAASMLVSKNLGGPLYESLAIVIEAVNLIKSHALQDRLFLQFCEENGNLNSE